jgi:hypothetical protein
VSTAKAVKHKLEEHLPIDELSVAEAVSTAKQVKHNIEQRYKPQPRKSKARIVIPLLLAFLVGAVVAAKILRDRGAAQPAPFLATNQTNDANLAVGQS